MKNSGLVGVLFLVGCSAVPGLGEPQITLAPQVALPDIEGDSRMQSGAGAAIVNNASIYGLRGSSVGAADYIATKHAVMGLTKTAAVDYAQQGIRVNAVCPGFTHSELVDPIMEENAEDFDQKVLPNVPMGRVADANEIATAVLWMLSDEASFLTGQAITPDGGWTAK